MIARNIECGNCGATALVMSPSYGVLRDSESYTSSTTSETPYMERARWHIASLLQVFLCADPELLATSDHRN